MAGTASKSRVFPEAIPAPVAVELGQDTGWELWTQALASRDAPPLPAAGAALEALLDEVRRDNRVCPQQARWVDLYKMLLQHAARTQSGLPPRILAGPAWNTSSSLGKRLCLRQQLEWAQAKGGLTPVAAFLRGLPDADWHYME
ncbi:hypothetical protein [Ramlibacter sp.]|uniref:hypothetical protein n=1 Tax=Ramlibacter sp. TaxID=1917967 RepID=UPI0017C769AF|nr:hypothetical protein [Ramlibacter sp.]MBA2674764.1 hypothetical protein [Ramlibacter sp.]